MTDSIELTVRTAMLYGTPESWESRVGTGPLPHAWSLSLAARLHDTLARKGVQPVAIEVDGGCFRMAYRTGASCTWFPVDHEGFDPDGAAALVTEIAAKQKEVAP